MKSKPISITERIPTIDIIRGFALFGIFLVNMPAFHSPDFFIQMNGLEKEETGFDFWVDLFFQLFIQMKFFTIFSFLFGLGFYIFMNRAEQKGLKTKALFTRRVLVLLLFGLLHLIFMWFGDILHTYAIAGLLLLMFYNRKTKTLLNWAFGLLIVFHALMSIHFLVPTEMLEAIEADMHNSEQGLTEYVNIYTNASYIEWVTYRLGVEIGPILSQLPFTMIPVLAMFLFGLYAGKIGVFQPNSPHWSTVRKTWLVTLILSLPFVTYLALLKLSIIDLGVKQSATTQLFTSLSGISLCFFYITSLMILLKKESWQKRLRPLGYAGQMALTNYLLQTILCFILFLGFGLYGKISLTTGTILCLIIYPLQMWLSFLWLKKYRFGPFEWLWRSLTYGYFQPIKREDAADKLKKTSL
ncbi:DUF418 domain-containing protein [Metabacillus herbersteinensis]|uniref:DUF418 domain-containing protein n=1 Tax=Metabacillus herbersteinensis TaxID=283816 RepID=A0ABV6GLT7_9BACI